MDQNPAPKNTVSEEVLANPKDLQNLIDYATGSVVSKTLIDKEVGNITLFSFDEGQSLSEHTSPFDAVLQVIDGTAIITIADQKHKVEKGQLIVMPANVPHSVEGQSKFKMLLIMIRQK